MINCEQQLISYFIISFLSMLRNGLSKCNALYITRYFHITADTSPDSLYIFCQMKTDHKVSVLFEIRGGVVIPEIQDQQFVGRVQWDKDVLRDGRLRLHVSRLRTEDSGQYLCDVRTNYGVDFGDCRLSVSGKLVDE